MKILLTGGCGFIGSHLLDELLEQGHTVVVVDNFRSGRIQNIQHHLDNPRLICAFGDILDEEFISSLDTDFDAIYHHAAQLEITRCMEHPQEDIQSNMLGTTNIFEHAKRCPGLKRVIYASTAAVYGQAQTELQSEDHPINPHWIYGVSKYATEMLADIYATELGIPFVGLRYAIVYGPREWYGRVLTLFIKNAIEDGKIVVFDQGEEVRDYIHVRDVVSFNLLLLSADIKGSTVYNVSSASKIQIRELAQNIKELTGCEVIYEDVPEGEASAIVNTDRVRLKGNLRYLCQDNKKAMALGWKPQISFIKGLKEELDWYKKTVAEDPSLWTKMFY